MCGVIKQTEKEREFGCDEEGRFLPEQVETDIE